MAAQRRVPAVAPPTQATPIGPEIQVYTNSVTITRPPTKAYYQYDDITTPGSNSPLHKRRNYEIIDQVQTQHAKIFNPRAIYDGRKIMFSSASIPSTPFTLRFGRAPREKVFKITIRRVGVVDSARIKDILTGAGTGNLQPLNLLQLIVRQAPNMRHGFPTDARSFFLQEGSKGLLGGLNAHRGYFQSVRPTPERLLINIDTTNAIMYRESPLPSVMLEWLGKRNERDLQNLDPAAMNKLRMYLRKVLVRVIVSPKMRPRPIADLVLQAGLQEFDGPDGPTTVQRHFEKKYNRRVDFPHAVGVRLGRTAVIPAEFCVVIPGQPYRKKITPDVQREFLSFSLKKPEQRFKELDDALRQNLFNYDNSDFLAESGMKVDSRILKVKGLVIKTPEILYGNNQNLSIQPKAGAWNVLGQKFLEPRALKNWAVVYFTDFGSEDTVKRFVAELINGHLEKLGIVVSRPWPPPIPGDVRNPTEALGKARRVMPKDCAWPFLLVILPDNASECRQAVKYWGDVQNAVITQCVKSPKWERAKGAYYGNVALKINAKLGGLNSHVEGLQTVYNHSMVIGADVGHPSPGVQNRPSITGLVASVGPGPHYVASMTSLQQPRWEVIQDLEDMILSALVSWRKCRAEIPGYNKPVVPPQNLIFYRDGVSDGELENLKETEIKMIERAVARTFQPVGVPPAYWPKLLFIVVSKRHHVRFFPDPQRPNDADGTGNCPAGLVVTRDLKMPQYDSFYLQSHSGILGTSRPAHYIVLRNDTGLSLQDIQLMTFRLCHVYASATRSVSIPAPVYYADKLCARFPLQCENGASLSDTASEFTGDPAAEFNMAQWQGVFKQSRLKNTAYFL